MRKNSNQTSAVSLTLTHNAVLLLDELIDCIVPDFSEIYFSCSQL